MYIGIIVKDTVVTIIEDIIIPTTVTDTETTLIPITILATEAEDLATTVRRVRGSIRGVVEPSSSSKYGTGWGRRRFGYYSVLVTNGIN